jgi:hypothetical protein
MLHGQGVQPETRDRGPLLEELRRLGASSAPMGVYSWDIPLGKKDVKQHQDYLNAIKGSMDALLEKVYAYYNMDEVVFFWDVKESFDNIKKKFEKNFHWYIEKEKTVENALIEFQGILNMTIEARRSVEAYFDDWLWTRTDDYNIYEAVNPCLLHLDAYTKYIHRFVRN